MKKDNSWRNLEILALDYVEHYYPEEILVTKGRLTQESHDGGYDGVLKIRSNSNSSYRVNIEAKMRKTKVSLSLDDCAKSIIIAFNSAAKELHVVSNIGFSPQIRNEVKLFQIRTAMTIYCVNGKDLANYIDKHKERLISEKNLSKDFLKEITEDAKKIQYSSTTKSVDAPPYIEGTVRKEQAVTLRKKLVEKACIHLLTGPIGVGKSTFFNEIVNSLSDQFIHRMIDLRNCVSIQVLFLDLLEIIWGVKLTKLVKSINIQEDIDEILMVNSDKGDQEIADLLEIVKHILLKDSEINNLHPDIHNRLLLEYLDAILKKQKNNIRLIVHFTNVNESEKAVVQFIASLVLVLKDNGVRVVIEAPSSLTLKSQKLLELFSLSIDEKTSIDIFTEKEAIEFIQFEIPTLNERSCLNVAEILDFTPLDISASLVVLKESTDFNSISFNSYSKKEQETFLEKCGISRNKAFISLIHSFKEDSEYDRFFYALLIFGGEMPIEICTALQIKKVNTILTKLKNCRIIFINEDESKIEVRHSKYLEVMKSDLSCSLLQFEIARKISQLISEGILDTQSNPTVEIELLYLQNQLKEIPQKTLELSQYFKEHYQYQEAVGYLNRIINKIKKYPYNFDENETIQLIFQLLDCMEEMHEFDNEECYNLIKTSIEFCTDDLLKKEYSLRFELFIWNKEFSSKNYNEAYKKSSALFKKKESYQELICAEELIGRIYYAYGLSTKMVFSGNEALKIMEQGVKSCPNSIYAIVGLYTQKANHELKTDPTQAKKSYQGILQAVKNRKFPYRLVIHTRLDIVMSTFLEKNFEDAYIFSCETQKTAASLGMTDQVARALNFMGCSKCALNDIKSANQLFNDSINRFVQAKAFNYTWRPKLNLAMLHVLSQSQEEQTLNLFEIADFLIENLKEKIINDAQSTAYQGLLLLLKLLDLTENQKKIQELLQEFSTAETLHPDFLEITQKNDWKNRFNSKVMHCGMFVLVTG